MSSRPAAKRAAIPRPGGNVPACLKDWRAPVLVFADTDSTQDVARKLAEAGAPEWSLVIARRQRRGRGRLGRSWNSGHGGLYVSIVLRPRLTPKNLSGLSLLTAGSVAHSLTSATGLPTAVKPPNDILAARLVRPEFELSPSSIGSRRSRTLGIDSPPIDAFRKISGILLESSGSTKKTDWVILGIGVNVNNRIPSKLTRATSLMSLADRRFDVDKICRAMLDRIKSDYRRLREKP